MLQNLVQWKLIKDVRVTLRTYPRQLNIVKKWRRCEQLMQLHKHNFLILLLRLPVDSNRRHRSGLMIVILLLTLQGG